MLRRSSAASLPSLERATFVATVPAWRIACPAARPPIFAVRRTLDFGILLPSATGPVLSVSDRVALGHFYTGPRDDVVAPVGPADPGLVTPVVVASQQDQLRGLSQRETLRLTLGIDAPPDPHERIVLKLFGNGRRVRVARVDHGRGRERQERLHDRVLQIRVGCVAGGAHARPTEPLKRVSPVNTSCPSTTNETMPAV